MTLPRGLFIYKCHTMFFELICASRLPHHHHHHHHYHHHHHRGTTFIA
ncbi:hypothetical protein E2C01_076199 [Portunus trituberculatus]|uniref:Uncharacterized protein n=1 Tax=Portunus trituberculatus TaxID=210409 RepID=A0A5B7IN07_PORTR|nr:hypothetical protein [Portunus trituberculatus]